MKPLPRDKFSSFSPRETDCNRKKRVSILKDQIASHLSDAVPCKEGPMAFALLMGLLRSSCSLQLC